MSMSESILIAVFVIVVVFATLCALYVFIKLYSFIINKLFKDKTQPEQKGKTKDQILSADLSSGELILQNVSEDTAAIIMAIVSHESDIPLSELRFKSIKALE